MRPLLHSSGSGCDGPILNSALAGRKSINAANCCTVEDDLFLTLLERCRELLASPARFGGELVHKFFHLLQELRVRCR